MVGRAAGRPLTALAALPLLVWLAALAVLVTGVRATDPVEDPAEVPPPAGLELPRPADAPPVAAPLDGGAVSAAAVRAAVGELVADRRLGRRVALVVAGTDGRPVLSRGPATVTPASTLKLLTSLAALAALGAEHRFTTGAVREGRVVTLVGGGDPLLAREPDPTAYPEVADLRTLARRVAGELRDRGASRVRVAYDASLFTGPAVNPAWEPDYVPDDVVSPITALWVDEGRRVPGLADRSTDSARDAARVFAGHLEGAGIAVAGRPEPRAATEGAAELAQVRGAELVEVVQHVLETSDNEASEVLARHVALAEGAPGSAAAGARAVTAVARSLGVPLTGARVLDGSGLARGNRLAPRTLLAVLALAADDPDLAALTQGLPVAGFTGSLAYRFATRASEGLGWVRAKTGTLTGVHGLAGAVTARDGTLLTFVALADRVRPVRTLFARDRLDQIASALAGCRCGA